MTFDYRTYWPDRIRKHGRYRGPGDLTLNDGENRFLQASAEHVVDELVRDHEIPTGLTLDCGCGTGLWMDYWQARGRGYVRGCDLVNVNGDEWVFGMDLCVDRLPLGDHTIALASCLNIAFHLVSPGGWQHFVDEITRVVRPGGYVVLNDGNVSATPSVHVRHRELAAYPWRMVEGPRPFRDTFVALFMKGL